MTTSDSFTNLPTDVLTFSNTIVENDNNDNVEQAQDNLESEEDFVYTCLACVSSDYWGSYAEKIRWEYTDEDELEHNGICDCHFSDYFSCLFDLVKSKICPSWLSLNYVTFKILVIREFYRKYNKEDLFYTINVKGILDKETTIITKIVLTELKEQGIIFFCVCCKKHLDSEDYWSSVFVEKCTSKKCHKKHDSTKNSLVEGIFCIDCKVKSIKSGKSDLTEDFINTLRCVRMYETLEALFDICPKSFTTCSICTDCGYRDGKCISIFLTTKNIRVCLPCYEYMLKTTESNKLKIFPKYIYALPEELIKKYFTCDMCAKPSKTLPLVKICNGKCKCCAECVSSIKCIICPCCDKSVILIPVLKTNLKMTSTEIFRLLSDVLICPCIHINYITTYESKIRKDLYAFLEKKYNLNETEIKIPSITYTNLKKLNCSKCHEDVCITCGMYCKTKNVFREHKCEVPDDQDNMNDYSFCPLCKVPVFKDKGCKHMTCKQCEFEWCWICKKVWTGTHLSEICGPN